MTMVVKFIGTPSMGEGLGGNINPMKVLSTAMGDFAYLSPSAILKQPLMEYLVREKGWELKFGKNIKIAPKKNPKEKPPLQITSYADDDPFADIFGYLFTQKKEKGKKQASNTEETETEETPEETRKRKSPLGVSYAVGLMDFKNCLDYRSNLGLVELSGSKGEGQMLFQREIDMNYFVYTLNLDLERVGKEPNKDNETNIDEKLKRVKAILEAIPYIAIHRNGALVGTLRPHLVVGGVFERKFPYFIDSIVWDKVNNAVKAQAINDIIYEYQLRSDDNNLLVFGIHEGFPLDGKVNIDSMLPKKAIDTISDFICVNKDKIWKTP